MADLTNADIINAYANVPQHIIEAFGDQGDLIHQYLLNPALFSLLSDVRDTPILDAGCRQGYLARLLAKRGARVTGLEPSDGFYRYAVHREQTEQLGIQYVQADLSSWVPPASTFQTVIANMVLMDIPVLSLAIACRYPHPKSHNVVLAHTERYYTFPAYPFIGRKLGPVWYIAHSQPRFRNVWRFWSRPRPDNRIPTLPPCSTAQSGPFATGGPSGNARVERD